MSSEADVQWSDSKSFQNHSPLQMFVMLTEKTLDCSNRIYNTKFCNLDYLYSSCCFVVDVIYNTRVLQAKGNVLINTVLQQTNSVFI
jgi:hypothetical protein